MLSHNCSSVVTGGVRFRSIMSAPQAVIVWWMQLCLINWMEVLFGLPATHQATSQVG